MLFQFVLFGLEQADSVGWDAVHEEDADVETWGVAVKADFHLVGIALVQIKPLDKPSLQVEDPQLGGLAAFRKRVADAGNGGEGVGDVGVQLARFSFGYRG